MIDPVDAFLDVAERQFSGIPLSGSASACFTLFGRVEGGKTTGMPQREVDALFPGMKTLETFLRHEPEVLHALVSRAPLGLFLQIHDGCVLLRSRVGLNQVVQKDTLLGARRLATPEPTPMESVLGDLARQMSPDTETVVWEDRGASMHGRIEFLAKAPGIDTFVERLTAGKPRLSLPLRLLRFEQVAVLADQHDDVAWMSIDG